MIGSKSLTKQWNRSGGSSFYIFLFLLLSSFYFTGIKGALLGLFLQMLFFVSLRQALFKFYFGENYLSIVYVLKKQKIRIYYSDINKVETILGRGGYFVKVFLQNRKVNINYSSMFPDGQYGRDLTESIIKYLVIKNCRVIDYSGIVK